MEPAFIDSVKSKCFGYYIFYSTSPADEATSINEILHFIHSYIINNEKILQSIPLLKKKNNSNNYNISLKIIVKEFVKFINCRLISGFIEVIGLFIIVDKLNIMDMLAKVLIGVIVIILNYIFSKVFVFNNN